ncbi:MAG: ABC transporter permease [Ancrocorticia sp.]|uniref:ABC transporter permease n=1 Tax=Ancrocorticia sp. TaxID=2593684 RepID=UPI003F9093B3
MKVLKRIWSITRAETILFSRNPTIFLTALLLPAVMVVILAPTLGQQMAGAVFASFLVQTLAAWGLLLVIYVNLTTIFVARRQEGFFQRMATGEATSWEAMIGGSIPSFLVAVVQVVIAVLGSALFVDGAGVTNPLLVAVAVLGGAIFLGALAAWTSRFTNTVEGAQYSTMPIMMALILTSGTLMPLSLFPDRVAQLLEWTPFYAMGDLISLGMTGEGVGAGVVAGAQAEALSASSWEGALVPAAVLIAWCGLALLLAKRTMVFAPRR